MGRPLFFAKAFACSKFSIQPLGTFLSAAITWAVNKQVRIKHKQASERWRDMVVIL
jgi:hypothetical protein